MLEKRMGGEIDLAGDADAIGKCERAMEPKIILELIALDAVEPEVEIIMPPLADSPSVATLSPTSACLAISALISRSSIVLSCSAVISPVSRFARAALSSDERRKLPTWSARNGAVISGMVLGASLSASKLLCAAQQTVQTITAQPACNLPGSAAVFDRERETAYCGLAIVGH